MARRLLSILRKRPAALLTARRDLVHSAPMVRPSALCLLAALVFGCGGAASSGAASPPPVALDLPRPALVATDASEPRPVEGRKGDSYDVFIDGKAYAAAEGRPFFIEVGGNRVEAVIRARAVLQYAKHDISFQYPKDMTISEEPTENITTITLETSDSSLVMIQLYSLDLEPDHVESLLVASLEKEMSSRGAVFTPNSGATETRRIDDKNVDGKRLEFALAKEPMRTAVYSFRVGRRTVALVLQRSDSDAAAAEKRFRTITESLRVR